MAQRAKCRGTENPTPQCWVLQLSIKVPHYYRLFLSTPLLLVTSIELAISMPDLACDLASPGTSVAVIYTCQKGIVRHCLVHS